jgi:TM2 domain-containing membrane protein YozV
MTNEKDQWLQSLKENTGRSGANWWTTFWLSLLLGYFGADRFYLNSPMLGVLKLLTVGGLGLWWLADLVLLCANQMHDDNGGTVRRPF